MLEIYDHQIERHCRQPRTAIVRAFNYRQLESISAQRGPCPGMLRTI
jgi:hypothetical protein